VRRAADVCTTLRIALAPLFAWAVMRAHDEVSLLPLIIYAVAAASDFVDGRLARATGSASIRGRLFDHGADALFLFPTLIVLAGLGRVSFVLPCAAMVAFALYTLDGWRRGGSAGAIALLPSQWGALGGVSNYVVAGGAAVALALGPTALDGVVFVAALLTAGANLVAAGERVPALWRWWGDVERTLTSRIERP